MAWFELAKVGTWKSNIGQAVDLTAEKLKKIAENYNPKRCEAAVTIGHPKSDKEPAYGWIKGLKFDNDKLLFEPKNLVNEFSDMVKKGMFKNVSAGFDEGVENLRHVAFLGAVPPAIKGLSPVQFSGESDKTVTIDFTNATDWLGKVEFSSPQENFIVRQIHTIARILGRLRDKEIEEKGVDQADRTISQWEISDLMTDPPDESLYSGNQFSMPLPITSEEETMDVAKQIADLTAKIVELSNQIKTVEGENLTLKQENATLKSETQKKEFSEFCQGLIDEGRLAADQKNTTVTLMQSMMESGKSVEFSEGRTVSTLEAYKEQLKKAPKLVEFSEVLTRDRTENGSPSKTEYQIAGESIAAMVNPKK